MQQRENTEFNDNFYTGCSDECAINTYTMPARIAKDRMITYQEASPVGCTRGKRVILFLCIII